MLHPSEIKIGKTYQITYRNEWQDNKKNKHFNKLAKLLSINLDKDCLVEFEDKTTDTYHVNWLQIPAVKWDEFEVGRTVRDRWFREYGTGIITKKLKTVMVIEFKGLKGAVKYDKAHATMFLVFA
jgi:hypothetical protein